MGVKEVDTQAKPEKRDKSISSAVNKIFKNYPPKLLASGGWTRYLGGIVVRPFRPVRLMTCALVLSMAGRVAAQAPSRQASDKEAMTLNLTV